MSVQRAARATGSATASGVNLCDVAPVGTIVVNDIVEPVSARADVDAILDNSSADFRAT